MRVLSSTINDFLKQPIWVENKSNHVFYRCCLCLLPQLTFLHYIVFGEEEDKEERGGGRGRKEEGGWRKEEGEKEEEKGGDPPGGRVDKNLPVSAEDMGSIPGLEDSPCHGATKPMYHKY